MKVLWDDSNPALAARLLFGVVLCGLLFMVILMALAAALTHADTEEDSDDVTGKSLECDVAPQSCACDTRYCSEPEPEPEPTPEPTRDCNGPFHPSCVPTSTPTPEPTPATCPNPHDCTRATPDPTPSTPESTPSTPESTPSTPESTPTTTLPSPGAPTGLRVDAEGLTYITLRWNARSGTSKYQVDSGVANSVGARYHDASGAVKTVGGLSCETEYTFKVRTYGNGRTVAVGPSGWSGTVKGTTEDCIEVEVTVSDSQITEGGETEFIFTASPAPSSRMNVSIDVRETGDFVSGYSHVGYPAGGAEGASIAEAASNSRTVYFGTNRSKVGLKVRTENDKVDENDGGVRVSINDGSGARRYVAGSSSTATVTIRDNDEEEEEEEEEPEPTPTPTPSNNAALSALEASSIVLSPAFSSNTITYTATAAHDVTETTVTATRSHIGANYVIQLGGVDDADGTIPLSVGRNVISVVVTAQNGNTIRTYTVTVTRERPPFRVTILYCHEYLKKCGNFTSPDVAVLSAAEPHWQALDPFDLKITVETIADQNGDRPEIPTGYEFSLKIDTGGTGLQISDTGECDWRNSVGQSVWFGRHPTIKYRATNNQTTERIKVVRCARGETTNNGFTVMAKKDGGNEELIRNITIKEAPHRADNQVVYEISSDKNSPTYIDTPTRNGIDEAVKQWNGAQKYLTFKIATANTTADTTIKRYSPYGADECNGGISCVDPPSGDPHLGYQEFWIESPPQAYIDPVPKQWTNIFNKAVTQPRYYYYLPHVMMHELGHTAGLGHPPKTTNSVMPHGGLLESPTGYDADAMRHLYQGHTSH